MLGFRTSPKFSENLFHWVQSSNLLMMIALSVFWALRFSVVRFFMEQAIHHNELGATATYTLCLADSCPFKTKLHLLYHSNLHEEVTSYIKNTYLIGRIDLREEHKI